MKEHQLQFAMTLPVQHQLTAQDLFRDYVKTVQCGWMPCVACSDSKGKPWKGRMWLGGNNYVECPVCKGRMEVPQYKQFDIRTGLEIDYERFGKE